MKKNRLGKGLDALLSTGEILATEEAPRAAQHVDPALIRRNPDQPRHHFDESKLEELAESIKASGILQPLVVQRTDDGYQLIAGERRLRAAMRLGLTEVPIVVRDSSDDEPIVLALIENLQREDLNPMEEAEAFARLQNQFQLSQEQIAAKVGKSRPAIANSLRLLSLPEEAKAYVAQGKLPAGQARALIGLEPAATLIAAAREAVARGLSTRETELLAKRIKTKRRTKSEISPNSRVDPNITAVIDTLQHQLGTRVRLKHQPRANRGRIEIEYYSLDDLDRITHKIMA